MAIKKYKYEIISYWSKEDNRIIAEVPKLPGCVADDENSVDVVNQVQLVSNEWIETALSLVRPIPLPKVKPMDA